MREPPIRVPYLDDGGVVSVDLVMGGMPPCAGRSVAASAVVVEVADSGELGVGFWMDRSRKLEAERVADFGGLDGVRWLG